MIDQNSKSLENTRIDGIVIGVLMEVRAGQPMVLFPESGQDVAVPALSTVALTRADLGAQLALSFENGDPGKPIILGKLLRPEGPTLPTDAPVEVEVDGEPAQTLITGREKVVLRCGKASITLTPAGKVLIKGTYISSRSSGMNRIKGGSVNLN